MRPDIFINSKHDDAFAKIAVTEENYQMEILTRLMSRCLQSLNKHIVPLKKYKGTVVS
jgi:hypothetical protein